MSMLPDFRLETYFSQWEFAARYHLTASDAQTISLSELLDLADEDGRARWESLQSRIALSPEDNWALDLETLQRALRPNTRLVSVNFPNNPTGAVPDKHTWRALVELCDERGIHLFSDEVYRGLELNRGSTLAQAADVSPTALSLNVLSKAYGLPGLRIGWIACRDRTVLDRLERAKHYTSICNSAPSEILGLIALRAGNQLLEKNRRIIADNLLSFGTFFSRHPTFSSGRNLKGVASPFPATSDPKAWSPCAPRSSKKPECFCCPPASTALPSQRPPLIGSGLECGAAAPRRHWMSGTAGWTNGIEPARPRAGADEGQTRVPRQGV